ncbi:Os07g0582100 [Oryza sativa Japonica Group]|uniref:Os07g0582100 protein n=1 Tax=Oryza sativa subsp. japonica TaxID=39947 RepID=Q0D552_ORYSJ|nr:Os07g0582100 [Oryza sativa Japonica Group]|eukprot:NP_001060107.1 Os07g0582100 [Oryza sativa Japonica Group]
MDDNPTSVNYELRTMGMHSDDDDDVEEDRVEVFGNTSDIPIHVNVDDDDPPVDDSGNGMPTGSSATCTNKKTKTSKTNYYQRSTRDFYKMLKDRRSVIIDRLNSASSIALTSDIWSGHAKEDYLSVVAHFVNSDWQLEKRVLGLRLIDESHTGANIAERVIAVAEEYGITDKIAGHLNTYGNVQNLANVVGPMKTKFMNYWSKIPILYSFAFILDPRAKIRGFSKVLQIMAQLIGDDYSAYLTTVRASLSDTFAKYERKFGSVGLRSSTILGPSTSKKRTAWGKIFGSGNAGASLGAGLGAGNAGASPGAGLGAGNAGVSPGAGLGAGSLFRMTSATALLQAASSTANLNSSELSAYLDSDTVNQYDDDFNILSWWQQHKLTYPVLSILAKDVMTVPISTISSESTFSLTGRIIEDRRRRLNPRLVEILAVIKDWELADAKGQHTTENVELQNAYENMYLDDEIDGVPGPARARWAGRAVGPARHGPRLLGPWL